MKHLSASGVNNLGAAISMLILASLSVALRLFFRLQARERLTLSDLLIVLAVLVSSAEYALLINYIVYGPGPGTFSNADVTANLLTGGITWGNAFLKTVYIIEPMWITSITLAKFSILALYHDIFGISITFRRINYAMAVLVGFFGILFALLFVLQCHPVEMAWNMIEAPSHCMSYIKVTFAAEMTNFLVDVGMLAMPLVMVSKLNLPKKKKWSVGGMLLLGGMVCVVSLIRLCVIWDPKATYWIKDSSLTVMVAAIQFGFAVLCACLPTYAPLLRLFRRNFKWGSSNQSGSKKVYSHELTPRKAPQDDKDLLTTNYTEEGITGTLHTPSMDQLHGFDPFGDYDRENHGSRDGSHRGAEAV